MTQKFITSYEIDPVKIYFPAAKVTFKMAHPVPLGSCTPPPTPLQRFLGAVFLS